jgi:outer membrane protein OmpA-like peptidoglycan-associated protein
MLTANISSKNVKAVGSLMRNAQFTSSFPGTSQEVGLPRAVHGGRVAGSVAAVLAALWLLSACSSVPDAVNPVKWYKGTADWLSGEEESAAATETAEAAAIPEPSQGKQSFPTLAEVPERPIPTTTVEERRRLMEGLAADREHARYAEDLAAAEAKPDSPPGAEPSAVPPAEIAAAPEAAGEQLLAPLEEAPSAAAGVAPTPAEPAPSEKPEAAPGAGPKEMAAAPEAPGRKRLVSPLEAAPPPPPPPAPKAAPRAEGAGQTPSAPAPEGERLGEVYRSKLAESAPTVATTPVGPTAEVAALPPEAAAGPPAGGPSPRPLGEFDPFRSTVSVKAGTILFAHNSSRLTADERKLLEDIAGLHKQRGGTLRVIGHASSRTRDMDPVGHQLANLSVSMRRANAVARELIRSGVDPDKIFVGAQSDSEPIYYESMPAGEAGNRRAEIFIDY